MDMSKFGDQLFNSLTAMNLRTAKSLRPLTDSEKELLKKSEKDAGDVLPQMEHFKEQNPFNSTI